jgi:hypothetical protein
MTDLLVAVIGIVCVLALAGYVALCEWVRE